MKNNILILFITCAITSNLYGQSALKAGDKAPVITISDYISNVPQDKTLKNKYILLEFWASWCAPCLGAVPHLNELQDKYKNRKDILFISMTNESPEKTLKTLQRIKFKTMVVSDQSEKSHTDFGAKQKGTMTLPRTVLIDNKGFVRWIGMPDQMTDSLFERFLQGAEITTKQDSEPKNIVNPTKTDLENANISNVAWTMLRNKQTQCFFSLLNAAEEQGSSAYMFPAKGEYVAKNYSFKSILSDLLKVQETQIVIPESINDKKYSVFYKNVSNKDEKNFIEDIKTNLLKALNLREKIESKTAEVYRLKVRDKNKLQQSKEQSNLSHSGDNNTHLVFSNVKMEKVIKEVSCLLKMNILDETNLTQSYDFIIRKGTKADLMSDFESYGLTLERVDKNIEFYVYE